MYSMNRNLGSSLYTDDMIYSPLVPVIRDDNDELLDRPFMISIITVPAVNAGAVRQKGKQEEIDLIESTMLTRTEKLLSVAVIHGYKVRAVAPAPGPEQDLVNATIIAVEAKAAGCLASP